MILGGKLPSRFTIERIPFPALHAPVDIRPDISLERAKKKSRRYLLCKRRVAILGTPPRLSLLLSTPQSFL